MVDYPQKIRNELLLSLSLKVRDKIWLVHYIPADKSQSDFFRIFTDWGELLESMSIPPALQHPAWQHPFEIWQLDLSLPLIQEVSEEVMRLLDIKENQDERPTDEERNSARAD